MARVPDDATAFDGIIWPIVQSAVDLLTSDAVGRLKRCGECDWLFVDDSKNQSRTWCKKECGDRVRARRHYRLVRGRQGERHGGSTKPAHLDRLMEKVDGKSKRRSSG